MPCEVVLLRVDFFKMADVSMETAKMPKNFNSQHHNLIGNQILPKSEDFFILTATIANQNGRHMVQHVLLLVNIHFH
jgi:hypothetical protein